MSGRGLLFSGNEYICNQKDIFMKLRYITFIIMLLCATAYGQADFSWKVTKQSDRELLLTITGTLQHGWHVSSHTLQLERQDGLTPSGTLSVGGDGAAADADGGTVIYRQRFAVSGDVCRLKGYLQYVLCTDMMCMAPQTVEFSYSGTAVKTADKAAESQRKDSKDEGKAEEQSTAAVVNDSVVKTETVAADVVTDADFLEKPTWRPVIKELQQMKKNGDMSRQGSDSIFGGGLLSLFLLAFAGGLLALLTPCVWPMIPLTVSFFMKRGMGVRGAVLFGVCIVAIFLVAGLLLTMLSGANALNRLSTDAVFNVVCFVVLVLFGLSLLGLFELRLPSSWADTLDSKSNATGGIVSIFLMALTMVVVSFSCTAPVMGLLLVEIAAVTSAGAGAGSLLTPMVGMTGFALALALPFTLFALFPRLLQRMPRSGNWMTGVKVTLGFMELAFALKFLSVADMAYGWHILPRWLFIALWIALAFACGVWHSVDWRHKSINPLRRQKMAIVCYAFVFYLIPGLYGAPCTLVSAFLPPAESTGGQVYDDYDEALAEARKQGKPVFIDFTGYGCVNCRQMEAAVFTDARVREMLSRNFVVAQLYVDERTPLPATLQAGGRVLRTVGDKWALLEIYKFGYAAQPFYVIVNADGKPLTRSYAYDESAERFLEWLRSGL